MIGAMDTRITLQRAVETPDGIGGVTKAWADIKTVWAKIGAVRGSEAVAEGRVAAVETVKFTIWRRDDVGEAARIVCGGVVWNIRNVVTSSERKLSLDIVAERGVAG